MNLVLQIAFGLVLGQVFAGLINGIVRALTERDERK